MFGHDFGILVYALLCGGDTKFKLPKAGNGNVFFPNKRVRFARADKAVALQYHNQPVKHRHQRMWRFYPRGHRW